MPNEEIVIQQLKRYSDSFSYASAFKNKSFLITGSKGMLAKSLIAFLLYIDETFSLGIHIYASTRSPDKPLPFMGHNGQVTMCSFLHEDETINGNIDYIIHCATPTNRLFLKEHPADSLNVIVDGTRNMLEIAKRHHSVLLYVSSVEIYGAPNEKEPIKESYVGKFDPLVLRNAYPIGKCVSEYMCKSYSEEYGVDARIVRPSPIQGLFQGYDETRVYSQILRSIIEKTDIVFATDGSSRKPLVFSLDAVTAILHVLLFGKKGEAYNIANPSTFMSIRETTEHLFANFAPSLKIVFNIEPATRTGYLNKVDFNLDISKITSLGWKPLTNLDELYDIDIKRFSE